MVRLINLWLRDKELPKLLVAKSLSRRETAAAVASCIFFLCSSRDCRLWLILTWQTGHTLVIWGTTCNLPQPSCPRRHEVKSYARLCFFSSKHLGQVMNEEGCHSWATPACARVSCKNTHGNLDYEMVKRTNYGFSLYSLCTGKYDWITEGIIFLPFNLLAVPLPGPREDMLELYVTGGNQKGKGSAFFSRKSPFAQVPFRAGRLFVPLA